MRHGVAKYKAEGCRCKVCRRAKADYQAMRRRELLTQDVPQEKHGTYSGYVTYGCRCDKCKAANAEYHRNKRKRMGA